MIKRMSLALSLVLLAGLLTAAPALAGDVPAPAAAPVPSTAPFLCGANSSAAAPALTVPEPQPALIIFKCGVCSDSLCRGKNVGAACGFGPAYQGFRCNNPSSCPSDGLFTCSCELA